MEEHRYSCPSQVREFTRYRAHVDFSQDRPGREPAARDEGETAGAWPGEDGRAPAASDEMAAR